MMRTPKYAGVYPRVINALDNASTANPLVPGQRQITETMITEARTVNPRCKCDLWPGMIRHQVQRLGAGCTGHQPGDPPFKIGYVCPALDKLRRTLGH